MIIRELSSNHELLVAFPVLQELRPTLTPAGLVSAFAIQKAEGYRLFAVIVGETPVACIGWRIMTKLHTGKTLYIDDLVTAGAHRGRGYARALLDYAESEARSAGCRSLSLDSGYQRADAHRVYLNAGYRMTSHHFGKDL